MPDGLSLKRIGWLAIFGAPALLLLPALYYSLTTPFALVDDYVSQEGLRNLLIFDDHENALRWFYRSFVTVEIDRFRPFWEVANGFALQMFGARPWLHHLSRWIIHIGSIVMFVAAFVQIFRCMSRSGASRDVAVPMYLPCSLVAVGLLVYVWLFFPNFPAARLHPQEVHTVLFLGLCNWMIALTLADREGSRFRAMRIGLTCIGCIGICWSKETNLPLAVCTLAFQIAASFRQHRRMSSKEISVVAVAILACAVTGWRTFVASWRSGAGYGHEIDLASMAGNVRAILTGIFQLETAAAIGGGILLLLAALLVSVTRRIVEEVGFKAVFLFSSVTLVVLLQVSTLSGGILFLFILLGCGLLVTKAAFTSNMDPREFYLCLLLCQIANFFLALCLSYGVELRYWYVLIPMVSTALAFAGQYVIDLARYSPAATVLARLAMIAFLTLFIAHNYSNYLFQTIVQHSLRSAEQELIQEIRRLLDAGEHVLIPMSDGEHQDKLRRLFIKDGFLDYWFGEYYIVHTEPPMADRYYYVTLTDAPEGGKLVKSIEAQQSYGIFAAASAVASFLQGEPRFLAVDGGVGHWENYRWQIYEVAGRDRSLLIEAEFNIYFDRATRSLEYNKRPCDLLDDELHFYVHVVPANATDYLSQRGKMVGFDILRVKGIRRDGECSAKVELPRYPIYSMSTGRRNADGQRVWGADAILHEQGAASALIDR